MPDLFDGLFNKIGTKINGGKSVHHYGGASQVNSGSFYSYHSNSTNNKYWLPRKPSDPNSAMADIAQKEGVNKEDVILKPRMGSINSLDDYESKSRHGSVSSEQ